MKEEEIRYLKFPDNIRKRPGMYLGDLSTADIALREIIDNSCDEISAGYGKNILISTNLGGYNFVGDDGRGIPISYSKDKPDTTQAYLSISEIHSGSKFESTTEGSRVGLNGIGSSAINATSLIYVLASRITENNYNRSIPEVKELWENAGPRSKKDMYYVVVCEKGEKVYEGAMKLKDLQKKLGIKEEIPSGLSTIVLFKPDPEIYESTKTSIPEINLQYFLLIQEKFYGKKINVLIDGEKLNSTFHPYKHEFVKTIIPKDTSKNKKVDIYMTFQADPTLSDKSEIGSINGLESKGFHITTAETCFKTALKESYKIKHDYLTQGLQFCVIILAQEVSFNSQTKETLKAISGVKASDFEPVIKEIQKCFRKDEEYWENYVESLNMYAESMKSLSAKDKAQRIIEEASGRSIYKAKGDLIPGFSDATAPPNERWSSECELICCEGNSPGGRLKSARPNTKRFAILPLRGKVKNVKDDTVDEMMSNKELFTLFRIIGLGIDDHNVTTGCKTPEEAYEKIKKYSRYKRIIIATDNK